MRLPLAALALTLALTGCSDSGTAGADASAQPAPSAATSTGSFSSTAEIVAALGDAGLPCEEPMTGTYEGVSEAQSCILNDAEDVVLLVFADASEREDYLANKEELASAVVGQDWAIETVLPDTAQRIADALGGEVLRGATS